MRNVLGYRLYRDLKRGWRVTSPNLEQCGLLEIRYLSLDELCADPDEWRNCHRALLLASPETRQRIAKVLLDFMRRELAIKVDYLDPTYQEGLLQQSSQRLIEPWAIDENESQAMEHAAILFPGPRRAATTTAATCSCRRAAASASTSGGGAPSPTCPAASSSTTGRRSSSTCSGRWRSAAWSRWSSAPEAHRHDVRCLPPPVASPVARHCGLRPLHRLLPPARQCRRTQHQHRLGVLLASSSSRYP